MMDGIPGVAEGMNLKLIKIEPEVCLEKTSASKKGENGPPAAGEPTAAER